MTPPSDDGFGDDDGDWFRPVWEDDAEGAGPPLARPPVSVRNAKPIIAGADTNLLGPLCAAHDVVARLDAKAEVAPPAVREGLINRLAFREAAGWLAYAGAWVHPTDLALRDAHLLGPGEFASTAGASIERWDDLDGPGRLLAEGQVQTALHLARLLRQGARYPATLAEPEAGALALTQLGGRCDPDRLAVWLSHWKLTNKYTGSWLLRTAEAAADWMEAGIADVPSPAPAIAAVGGLLAQARTLRTIPLLLWSAAPALALGDIGSLPHLRSDTARRLFPEMPAPPPWPAAFVAMVTEAANAGLQELGRLQAAAAAGAKLAAGLDKRSRLPAAVDAVIREPAVTAKGLARSLKITPQAALRLVAELERGKVVREVTGRQSFRAWTT